MEIDRHHPVIEFPLRGEWAVVHSPAHHRYAFDFAAIGGPKKKLFSTPLLSLLIGKASASDSYSWCVPVYAPYDGEIVRASDDWPDRTRLNLWRDAFKVLRTSLFLDRVEQNLRAFAGNYIVIRTGTVYTLMAHLRYESLTVHTGQQIQCGEVIGNVGNFGNSLAPHLHFQVMDGADMFKSQILPFRFRR